MISIHALLAESDQAANSLADAPPQFLSTLSLRRATRAENHANSQQEFLSTLSLRRATNAHPETRRPYAISIHALLAESDSIPFIRSSAVCIFLSTLSLRRATAYVHIRREYDGHFYPRSPCGERPRKEPLKQFPTQYFYPRSPCGERPEKSKV